MSRADSSYALKNAVWDLRFKRIYYWEQSVRTDFEALVSEHERLCAEADRLEKENDALARRVDELEAQIMHQES